MQMSKHLIRSCSNNQSVIALSSAEAEYYSMVKGTPVSLGVKAMMSDLGVNLKVRLNTDASAAKGISAVITISFNLLVIS